MNEMNIEKLLQMQKVLDERIIKEKCLEGQDLTLNTVNALIVELSEFANEGRWFKHWSKRQKPKVEQEVCDYCGECVDYTRPSPFMGDSASMCKVCWNMTKEEYAASHDEHIPDFEDYPHFKVKEPKKLLEEYADGLHFFLSLANTKGYQDSLYIYEDAFCEIEEKGFSGGLSGAFLEMNYWLTKCFMEKDRDEKLERMFGIHKQEFCFKSAWFLFLAIGLVGFDFTFDQIEQAYCEKNKVNHKRQEAGY